MNEKKTKNIINPNFWRKIRRDIWHLVEKQIDKKVWEQVEEHVEGQIWPLIWVVREKIDGK